MRCLVLAAAVTILASGAHADEPWSGFYVGGNLGYGKAHANADFAVLGVPALSGSEDLSGAVYGAQAGYNAQFGKAVIGIEADIQGTSQKANATRICPALACGAVSITQTSSDSIPWFGTLRGRAGFAVDRFLIYGTGGVGYGEFKNTQTLTTTLSSLTTTKSDQRMAWVFGGGVEAAIDAHWRVRAEYLYMDTGNIHTTYSLAGVVAITETSRMTNNVVRLGLNYRF